MPYSPAEAEATVTVVEAVPPARLPPWIYMLAIAGAAGAGLALLLASRGR